jgi:cbb3-type cytochrome oxidase maturation protein
MIIMFGLLGVSLSLGAIGLAGFLWSLRTGQYEDLEGAASRVLFEE